MENVTGLSINPEKINRIKVWLENNELHATFPIME